MKQVNYNRSAAVAYAREWALKRNPAYSNFDKLGGDCTNFVSQCLFAGCGVMNYTKDTGWYYISLGERAAAWTDADYLNKFLLSSQRIGPTAVSVPLNQIETGDLIQLYNGMNFYHSLVVCGFDSGEPLVCAHTYDAYMKPLGEYSNAEAHGIHITGVLKW